LVVDLSFREKKGIDMALPIKSVVIVAIAAIVLTVLIYFLLGGFAFFNKAILEKDFRTGCSAICSNPDRSGLNLASDYPKWMSACQGLYGVDQGEYFTCMELCGGGCAERGDSCEYLRSFRPVMDNWLEFCNKVKTHPSTSAEYGNCEC